MMTYKNLGDAHLPSPKELFGTDLKGKALVELSNQHDKPQQDIVLPRCYRNPPWTLVTAHGLGFGIHRNPMAQIFTDLKCGIDLATRTKVALSSFRMRLTSLERKKVFLASSMIT